VTTSNGEQVTVTIPNSDVTSTVTPATITVVSTATIYTTNPDHPSVITSTTTESVPTSHILTETNSEGQTEAVVVPPGSTIVTIQTSGGSITEVSVPQSETSVPVTVVTLTNSEGQTTQVTVPITSSHETITTSNGETISVNIPASVVTSTVQPVVTTVCIPETSISKIQDGEESITSALPKSLYYEEERGPFLYTRNSGVVVSQLSGPITHEANVETSEFTIETNSNEPENGDSIVISETCTKPTNSQGFLAN
jgi:hypothetical protein